MCDILCIQSIQNYYFTKAFDFIIHTGRSHCHIQKAKKKRYSHVNNNLPIKILDMILRNNFQLIQILSKLIFLKMKSLNEMLIMTFNGKRIQHDIISYNNNIHLDTV